MDDANYEVCFTVATDPRSNQVTVIRPDQLFYGNNPADVVFKLRAEDEEEAEEKGYKMLTDPAGEYVKKYGPGFEVKKKYVWQAFY